MLDSSILCLSCNACLILNATEDVCLYETANHHLHIAIKFEKRLSLIDMHDLENKPDKNDDGNKTMRREKKFCASLSSSMKKKNMFPILCKKCDTKIGIEMPWGPKKTPFVALIHTKLIICGYRCKSKKEKLKSLVFPSCIIQWKDIELRNDDSFIPEEVTSNTKEPFHILVPEFPLKLPSPQDLLSPGEQDDKDKCKPSNITNFMWSDLTEKSPREYQIQAYVRALIQDLILVLPTGSGKTLVACMLITKLKQLNPSFMALFIVDRVPLVFQQAQAIETETDLRVCRLCGENKTVSTIHDLNDSRFDVLVITAGALVELQEKGRIDIGKQFCCIIFDECHHIVGGNHDYKKILNSLKDQSVNSTDVSGYRPRLLGLTASPATGKNPTQIRKKLNSLRENCFNATIFCPKIPQNPTSVHWIKVDRDTMQIEFCSYLIDKLRIFAQSVEEVYPERFTNDMNRSLDYLLLPSTLGRLRASLNELIWINNTFNNTANEKNSSRLNQILKTKSLDERLKMMRNICIALELTDTMGVKFALPFLTSLCLENKSGYIHHISPRIGTLVSKLLSKEIESTQASLSSRSTQIVPRVLIMVNTRSAASKLKNYLVEHECIGKLYMPDKIVGHGGIDGMEWFGEQDKVLKKFRDGIFCRLLVCTSVLEEGLDVPECDLVIRLQGIQGLTGFIQSKGRARKKSSEMLVFVNHNQELQRIDALRVQEELVKLSLSFLPPSPLDRVAQTFIEQALTVEKNCHSNAQTKFRTSFRKNWGLLDENLQMSFSLWIPNFERHIDVDNNEYEFIKRVVDEGFRSSGLSCMEVVQLNKIDNDLSLASVFDSCLGYLVGVAHMKSSNLDDSYESSVFSCIQLLTESWNFEVSGENVWIHHSPRISKELSDEKTFTHLSCSFGIWHDFQTYQCHYQLSSSCSVCFNRKDGLKIKITQSAPKRSVTIDIIHFIMQDFILIDWNEHSTGNINMFISLKHVPFCYNEAKTNQNERLDQSDIIVKRIAKNNVVCITFPSDTNKIDIYYLQQIFAIDIYFTRIRSLDAIHHPEADYLEIVGNDFCILINSMTFPIQEFNEIQDAYWLLLVLFSKPIGCLSPSNKEYLRSFLKSKIFRIHDDKTLAKIDLSKNNSSTRAVIFTLSQCIYHAKYWSNLKQLFIRTYDNFYHTSSNSKSLAYSDIKNMCAQFKNFLVTVTPSRIIYNLPSQERFSRLFHIIGSDMLVTVSFKDEHNERLRWKQHFQRIRKILRDGIFFLGQKYIFFCASNSHLREQKAIFINARFLMEKFNTKDADDALQRMREFMINHDETGCLLPSKYLSCFALFCSGCTPTVKLQDDDVIYCEDEMTDGLLQANRTILTDGSGKISLSTGKKIALDYLNLTDVPSAFQIRYKGVKGVVTVVEDNESTLKGRKMMIRLSMKKFDLGHLRDDNLYIIHYSKWLKPNLNREIITLLTSDANRDFDPEKYIYNLQEKELERCYKLFGDVNESMKSIMPELNAFTIEKLEKMKKFNLIDNPLFLNLLKLHHKISIHNLINKTRIPFEQGALLMGIADPLNVLKENEVYVCIDQDENSDIKQNAFMEQQNYFVVVQDVLIWRNPCLHPGDIRTVRAVEYQCLAKWKNVVIFPSQGGQNLALNCSGGDLDGDLYYVVWDKKLVPPMHCNIPPMNYASLSNRINPKWEKKNRFDNDELSNFISSVYSNDILGKISTYHLAISDMQESGTHDSIAKELSEAHAYAVDYPKTGISPTIPDEAYQLIRQKGYPDFMNKKMKSYCSNKLLGECYRRASSFGHNIFGTSNMCRIEKEFLTTRKTFFEHKDNSIDFNEAENFVSDYIIALNQIKNRYGLNSETECMYGRPFLWHSSHRNRMVVSQSIHDQVRNIQLRFERRFYERFGHNCEKLLSAAKIILQISEEKGCFSMELIISDTLYKIKNTIESQCNSSGSDIRIANALFEFVIVHDLKRQIESLITSKISDIDRLCSIFPPGRVHFYTFGSISLGLVDFPSDVDLVVSQKPINQLIQIEPFQKQIEFLEKISTQVGTRFLAKDDIFDAKVPLIRFKIESNFAPIQVDVVSDHSGFLKSQWLSQLFLEHWEIYLCFQVLTRWARSSYVVNGRNGSKQRLLAMGDFHVLILSILSDKICKGFQTLTSIQTMEIQGNFNQNCNLPELLKIFKTADKSIYLSAANLVTLFFERLSKYHNAKNVPPIIFEWRKYLPTMVTSQVIQADVLVRLGRIALPSLHSLFVQANVDSMFKVAAEESEYVNFSRELPLNLSYRLSRAIGFYEKRFSLLSNAEVEFRTQNGKANLLLVSKGTRYSIGKLENYLWNSFNSGAWGCRLNVQSSSYLMEDCSFVFLYGISNQRMHVKFDRCESLEKVNKLGKTKSILSIVNINNKSNSCFEDDEVWKRKITQNIAHHFTKQVSKIPVNKTGLDFQLTARFGSLVVFDIDECLPDTSLTLSIDEVQQAMEKSGRKRKMWNRVGLDLNKKSRKDNQTNTKERKIFDVGNRPKEKILNVKRSKPRYKNIKSTFFPSFVQPSVSKLQHVYRQSLEALGFVLVKEESNFAVFEASWFLSKRYEINVNYDVSSAQPKIEEKERPLHWVHGTILGSNKVPDIRIGLRMWKPLSDEMKKQILPPSGSLPIVLQKNGKLEYNEKVGKNLEKKLIFMKKPLNQIHYRKIERLNPYQNVVVDARITVADEYYRLSDEELDGPTKICEMNLSFDLTSFFDIRTNYYEWSKVILEISLDVAKSLQQHGVTR